MSLRKINKVKYIVLATFVLLYFMADAIMHKGLVRVMIPHTFLQTDVYRQVAPTHSELINKNKKWVKGVNSPKDLERVSRKVGGLEIDVYFDTVSQVFWVHHNPEASHPYKLNDLLIKYKEKRLDCSIWLDFKNLSANNKQSSLEVLMMLREEYQLKNKILVESQLPELLNEFAKHQFFTVYYTPYFNPYFLSKDSLQLMQEKIEMKLAHSDINALSGYYFQYPFLHERFPGYPILIWGSDDKWSVVNQLFNQFIKRKPEVFIMLVP